MEVYRVVYSVIGTLALDSGVEKSECLFITFNIRGQISRTYVIPCLIIDLITYDPV